MSSPDPALSAATRLARDLVAAGAPQPTVTPWGLEYDRLVLATAVPPPQVGQRWRTRPVNAVSDSVREALATAGIATAIDLPRPLLPLPDTSLYAGDHASGVVRCDDRAGDALGAFLLCWALQRPQARLSVGHPQSLAPARALGYPVEPAGAPPVVVVCAGAEPYPPPVVVDALAAGLAVVGVATPALVAVVGDAGLLVHSADSVETLAEALAGVLGDAGVATELGRRGRRRLEQLDPAATIRQVAAMLRST